MGQGSVTGLRSVNLPQTQTNAAAQEARVHTQAVASAVQVIKEVILQWPSDYALEMAQDYRKEHPET